MELGRAAAPLAMRGLREIGEFEVNGERFGDEVSFLDAEVRDNLLGLDEQGILEIQIIQIRTCSVRAWVLAMLNEDAPQLLDHFEQRLAGLLDQDTAQQDAEGADITAKREILDGIGGTGSQLGKPAALVIVAPTSAPQRRVTHVQS
jgi:hypothetical protein